jgi:hypothetical protein
MYLSVFTDKELEQYVKRAFKWLSAAEKDKIASELDRRGLKAPDPIERSRIEEKAGEEAKKVREKTGKALEREWRKNGCFKDSSGKWRVPYELIWRSLPRGEDR